jgi:hypothetical protein
MSVTSERGTSRRRHIRLVLHEGIFAELRIIGIGRRMFQTSPGKVVLLNLSPGGLRFATTLLLPPDMEWRVSIRFVLEGLHLEVKGRIRHTAVHDHWLEYGVQMDDNPLMCSFITRALNHRLKRMSPTLSRIHQLYASHLRSLTALGSQNRYRHRKQF